MESTIFGDVAIVKAKRGDKYGNLEYSMSARNFNADCATAAKYVIAEVEEIVEPGVINPDHVHTPAVYVDAVVLTTETSKPQERIVNDNGEGIKIEGRGAENRIKIATRVA